jgi:alpha-D-ribose 1-methylphosphonate 5-triphosphate synthase subunit PhnH
MIDQGFADVATESARLFRLIMQAMARPGFVMNASPSLAAPTPLLQTTAAVALTLCDFQTPIWLATDMRSGEVDKYLRFHSGAPITGRMEEAQFIIAPADDVPQVQALARGTHEYPDRSATLVIQVKGFRTDDVVLSGPGIKEAASFGVEGLGASFWAAMAENHTRFPVGVDVIFASDKAIAALPRSTAIKLKEIA